MTYNDLTENQRHEWSEIVRACRALGRPEDCRGVEEPCGSHDLTDLTWPRLIELLAAARRAARDEDT